MFYFSLDKFDNKVSQKSKQRSVKASHAITRGNISHSRSCSFNNNTGYVAIEIEKRLQLLSS